MSVTALKHNVKSERASSLKLMAPCWMFQGETLLKLLLKGDKSA